MNLTGVDLSNAVELDEIAEFKTTSNSMTGLLDANDGGVLSTSNLRGSYSVGSDGLGSATFNTGLSGMFFYAADSSTVLFLSTDSLLVGQGALESQTTPTQSALARPRALPMLRSIPRSHSASRASKALFVRK
jgi:hypothetical protein